MKILTKLFLSLKTTILLVSILIVSLASATFIENDFGTETARAVVYSSLWFQLLLIIITLNLTGNILRFKLLRKGKRFSLLFHSSFLVILLGAGITTFIGYEGLMHIREGDVSNTISSKQAYLRVEINYLNEGAHREKPLLLSAITRNAFSEKIRIKDREVTVRYRDFIPHARPEIVEDEHGFPIISLMVSENGNPQNIILKESDVTRLSRAVFAFNTTVIDTLPVVQIILRNDGLVFSSTEKITRIDMSSRGQEALDQDIHHELESMVLYSAAHFQFALQTYLLKGRIHAVPATDYYNRSLARDNGSSALLIEVDTGNQTHQTALFGWSGQPGESQMISVEGLEIKLTYGSKEISLPFTLKLKDFQLDRYPGSRKPSSYSSEVIIMDGGIERPFRIYMNHTLKHRGFRFFQHFYDTDESGTILSVSYDPGTSVTYIGYTLLIIGLLANLFNPKSRFWKLGKMVVKVQSQKGIAVLILLSTLTFFPKASRSAQKEPEAYTEAVRSFNYEHSRKFGELLVQDAQGRIKPMNTFAHEMLRKVSTTRKILDLHPDQIVLGIFAKPEEWQKVPIIELKHSMVNRLLGIDLKRKFASFLEFVDIHTGQYKLAGRVQETTRKPLALRDRLDKEILKVDERFNICRRMFAGSYFRICPISDDPNHTWTSIQEAARDFPQPKAEPILKLIQDYLSAINSALIDNDWKQANQGLDELKKYQRLHGRSIVPTESRSKAEIFYNEINIFQRLIPLYSWIGALLLVLIFVQLYNPLSRLKGVIKVAFIVLGICFIVHTAGFVLRWIVSGHAPWSNKYESMVYIAWATILAGFLFSKMTPISLAASSIFSGFILFIAHHGGIDPQITTLVPVLKSYWLVIHVSVITASYGFLGLGALLAFLTLMLFIFKIKNNAQRIECFIHELTWTNERALILGLTLITIGTFLGAVWGNESWGRYWGWDPKETWSLITILVYVGVVHLRLIPKLQGPFVFNVAALISFCTVIMTYFGVNVYLSGLHSYAQGDPVPIPKFVYVTVAVIGVVIFLASRRKRLTTDNISTVMLQ